MPKNHQIMRAEESATPASRCPSRAFVRSYARFSHQCVFSSGPYKVNGVPLRRVNQTYVIATSTKVNLEGVAVPAIDDAYFAKEKVAAKKDKEEQFFAQSSAVS